LTYPESQQGVVLTLASLIAPKDDVIEKVWGKYCWAACHAQRRTETTERWQIVMIVLPVFLSSRMMLVRPALGFFP
jgi:hypothetical protein